MLFVIHNPQRNRSGFRVYKSRNDGIVMSPIKEIDETNIEPKIATAGKVVLAEPAKSIAIEPAKPNLVEIEACKADIEVVLARARGILMKREEILKVKSLISGIDSWMDILSELENNEFKWLVRRLRMELEISEEGKILISRRLLDPPSKPIESDFEIVLNRARGILMKRTQILKVKDVIVGLTSWPNILAALEANGFGDLYRRMQMELHICEEEVTAALNTLPLRKFKSKLNVRKIGAEPNFEADISLVLDRAHGIRMDAESILKVEDIIASLNNWPDILAALEHKGFIGLYRRMQAELHIPEEAITMALQEIYNR